ncbi:hypothetical protein AB0E56_13120 [Microbacterium sp. NPDC028030]|uniref:hypothetical protein n=1 Tax=Microbacterium sp. NPDC028030 TaxID=3155124 RepID=UPI0033CC205E
MAERLTYREAAVRVRRSVLTIKRWRRNGSLVMGWGIREGQRVRLVDEATLLKCWRERMNADPIHQARLRKLRHAEETV